MKNEYCIQPDILSWSSLKERDRVILRSPLGTTIETEVKVLHSNGDLITPEGNILVKRDGWKIVQHIPYIEPLPAEPKGYATTIKFPGAVPFQRRADNDWRTAMSTGPQTWDSLVRSWGKSFKILYQGS